MYEQSEESGATLLQALIDPRVPPIRVNESLGLFVGNRTLTLIDAWLARQPEEDMVLKRFLVAGESSWPYDYCVIDSTADLDRVTRNALVAADAVVVPKGVRPRGLNELNVAVTQAEMRRIRQHSSLPVDGVSFPLQKPVAAYSEADWRQLTTRLCDSLKE